MHCVSVEELEGALVGPHYGAHPAVVLQWGGQARGGHGTGTGGEGRSLPCKASAHDTAAVHTGRAAVNGLGFIGTVSASRVV